MGRAGRAQAKQRWSTLALARRMKSPSLQGSAAPLAIVVLEKPQPQPHSRSRCARAAATAAQLEAAEAEAEAAVAVAEAAEAEASEVETEAEPEAAEAMAEAAAAEAEATRCTLEEESEMAALYDDAPNHLRVLDWTPAAEAGFEVVVLLHGWAAAVHDEVQVCAVCACATAATRHAHAHAMLMPCTWYAYVMRIPFHVHVHVHVHVVVRAALRDGRLSRAHQTDRVRMAERQDGCAAPGPPSRAPLLRPQLSRTIDGLFARAACVPNPLPRRTGATFVGGVNSANDAAVQRDFVVFVEGLLAAGVARLHIIAHSMGNRMLLGAVHLLRHVFTPERSAACRTSSQAPVGGDGTHGGDRPAAAAAAASDASSRTLPLGSVILLHPEADLDKCAAGSFFASSCRPASYPPHLPLPPSEIRCGHRHSFRTRPPPRGRFVKSDFAALRRVCSNISLYCDLRDPALFIAEGLVFRSTTLRTALLRLVYTRAWGEGPSWAKGSQIR